MSYFYVINFHMPETLTFTNTATSASYGKGKIAMSYWGRTCSRSHNSHWLTTKIQWGTPANAHLASSHALWFATFGISVPDAMLLTTTGGGFAQLSPRCGAETWRLQASHWTRLGGP